MLRLQITVRRVELAKGWSWDGRRWAAPCGWVEPFAHPALEHQMVERSDGQAAFLEVRERVAGTGSLPPPRTGSAALVLDSAEFGDRRDRAALWPLGFTAVDLLDHADERKVTVSCGATGAAPVQLAADGEFLHGSWDLLDLSPLWSVNELDVAEVTRFVSMRVLYSPATLFTGIRTLTERSAATFDGAHLSATAPRPALHARPRALRDGADPVAVFEELLQDVTGQWPAAAGTAAVELSGGMDSAIVAAALADLHGPVHTAVLELPGEAGAQQMERRSEMRKVLQLGPDHTIPVASFAPFHPGGVRAGAGRFSPHDGNYAEATALFQQELVRCGITTVFTGAAGDDMLALRPEERRQLRQPRTVRPIPPWLGPRAAEVVPYLGEGAAPAPVLMYSVLTGLEPRYPQTMRQGLWPVSPLASHALARFGEQLPLKWRRRKQLIRDALARRGMSQEAVWPTLRENFAQVMETSMRRWGIDLLTELVRQGSLLADHGIIDADAVLEMCQDGRAGGPVESLYRPLMLETALRSVTSG